MNVYIAFGTASVGKALFLALFEKANAIDLVGHSRNADEAIAVIKREKPELIIVEEVLTQGWGMDVVQSLVPRNDIPAIVMISTLPPPRPPQEYHSQNIDLWLQLPQDYEDLRSTLRHLAKDDPGVAVAAWRQKLKKMYTDKSDESAERNGQS